MTPQKIIIGENIKRIRKQKGLTQQQLADVLNVKRAAISKYEKGIVSPNSEQLWKIADALGVRLQHLIEDPKSIWEMDAEELAVIEEEHEFIKSLTGTSLQDKRVDEAIAARKQQLAVKQHRSNIIAKYDSLNSLGRQKADEYITDLSEQEKYTVPDDVE